MFKFASVLLFIFAAAAAEYVPALVWQYGSEHGVFKAEPALHKYSTDSFRDLLTKQAADKDLIIIFAEENLSVEDFNWQDISGETSFPKLSETTKGPNSNFYSRVDDPFSALMDLQGAEWSDVKLSLQLPSTILKKDFGSKFVIVNMDDATDFEDRPNLLKRHDEIVSRALDAAKSAYGKVLAVYTGHHSSWIPEELAVRRVRSLLQAEEPQNGSRFINADNLAYLYYSSAPTANLGGNNISLTNFLEATAERTEENEDTVTMYVTYDYDGNNVTIIFPFAETSRGYWNLDKISVQWDSTEYFLESTGIYAPFRFSYHCSIDTVFSNGTEEGNTDSLTFTDFQIEPLVPTDEQGEVRFRDAYDCISFFTMPIWSGIFVSLILIFVLTAGIIMIMEIKVMDKFDDPKGKTITVSNTD
ncbi:Hypothetical predicted protein [Cloeon dipterum]|uniref:V-type proton ATPase subunit S1 n=1 Tax=Cloeon dipterum TaxID=197152 RepID=A0A8S1DNY8_9INSE|nr:Hypothetical predicted protein [Cloeon dipterum]